MTKITWKPGTMLAPIPPALISCGTVEKPNVMTAAWTGIIASEPAMTYVSIRPSRYSHELIKESGEFVINLTNLPLVKAADWCGIKSGREIDKFKEMNLTAAACTEISAPQVAEAPVSLECKVKEVINYGTHDMFLAEIVAVNVDDKYIDEDGKLWLEKAGLVAYVHGFYYTLGRNLGKFGFSVEKKVKKTPVKDFIVKEDKSEDTSSEESFNSERKPRSDRFANKDKRFVKRGQDSRSNSRGEYRPRREREDRNDSYTPHRESRDDYRPRREEDYRPRRENRDEEYRPRRPRGDSESGERRSRNYNDQPRERRSYDDKPRESRSYDDKPRRTGTYDDKPREKRAFDDRKPKRFSDDRRDDKRGERRARTSDDKLKKFDGEVKFKRARKSDDNNSSSASRKHYGKPTRS